MKQKCKEIKIIATVMRTRPHQQNYKNGCIRIGNTTDADASGLAIQLMRMHPD